MAVAEKTAAPDLPVYVGFEDGEIELPPDVEALSSIARSAFLLGGSKELERITGRLRARLEFARRGVEFAEERLEEGWKPGGSSAALERARGESAAESARLRPVLNAWNAATKSVMSEAQESLSVVEVEARCLAKKRVERAREQVKTAARDYLGVTDAKVFAGEELEFPKGTTLQRGFPKVKELQEAMTEIGRELARAETELEKAHGIWSPMVMPGESMTPPPEWWAARSASLEARGRAAALADVHGERHPIVHRLTEDDPKDEKELEKRIVEELKAAWEAQVAVAKVLEGKPTSLAFGETPRVSPMEALGEQIDDDEDNAGPWPYSGVVYEAVELKFGVGPSIAQVAARETLGFTDYGEAFAEAAALSAAVLAAYMVWAPLGVAAGILLAGYEALQAIDDYGDKSDAANMALEPALALGVQPSAAALALRVAGAIVGALPGGKATAFSTLAPFAATAIE